MRTAPGNEMLKRISRHGLRKRFDELGCDVIGNTPQQFASIIKTEAPRWAKFIDQLGLKLD